MQKSNFPWALLAVAAVAGFIWFSIAGMPSTQPALPACPDGKCPAPPVLPQPPVAPPKLPARPRQPNCPNCPCSKLCVCGCQQARECICGNPPVRPVEGGPVAPDGTEVQCEIPVDRRIRNVGSRVDGAGMCVTTTTVVAADWCGQKDWLGLRDYCAGFPGGSTPQQHLRQLQEYASVKGLAPAPWAQYVGDNPAPFLDAALASGRMACVSWMEGKHWLNLVHLDDRWACIMDNNGDPSNLQWMPRQQCLRRISTPYAWVGAWTAPGPPPPPKGRTRPASEPVLAAAPGTAWPEIGCGVLPYDHLVGRQEYTLYGQPSTLEAVQAAFAAGQGPYLTVIGGDEQQRQRAIQALASDPAVRQANCAVHGYTPSDWAVRDGHVTTGAPTIYLQDRQGVPLLRLDSYTGPDIVAGVLRRRDPTYDPTHDPSQGPRGPWLPSLPSLPGLFSGPPDEAARVAGASGAVVAGGLIVLAMRRRRSK